MSERDTAIGEHKGWGIEIGTRAYVALYVRSLHPQTFAYAWDNFCPDIINGRTRSFYEDSVFFLRKLNKDIQGLENIPSSGPVLATANHPRFGLYNGYSGNFAFGLIAKDRRLRLIMQAGLAFAGKMVPFIDKLHQAQAESYGHIVVTPPQIREKGIHTTGNMQALKINRMFRQGEMIGLYPEATSKGLVMKDGSPLAGGLVFSLARTKSDGLICPVAIYMSCPKTLGVRVGEPYKIGELLQFATNSKDADAQEAAGRAAANYMLSRINPLLPRGYRNPRLS